MKNVIKSYIYPIAFPEFLLGERIRLFENHH